MATARPHPSGYKHVALDGAGVARIAGTNTKVREVVLDQLAYGWSPQEMHWQHPYLSLAQLHAALAYYYDHQAQIDQEIQEELAEVDRLRAEAGPSSLADKLRRGKAG